MKSNTIKYSPEWAGQDLDNDVVLAKFARRLKANPGGIVTPYWRCRLTDWLIYDTTIRNCGMRVESIDSAFVTLSAHCAGIRTDGICLDAVFKIPTRSFKTPDLVKIIGPHRYHKNGPACWFTWFPAEDDRRISPCNILELVWWYDETRDEHAGK